MNSVTEKKKGWFSFWPEKVVLLRSVCQRPIKVNSNGQAAHPAMEGFSLKAHWQDTVVSARSLPLWNDVMSSVVSKVYIGFCFGSTVEEVRSSYFWGGRHPKGDKQKLLEKIR